MVLLVGVFQAAAGDAHPFFVAFDIFARRSPGEKKCADINPMKAGNWSPQCLLNKFQFFLTKPKKGEEQLPFVGYPLVNTMEHHHL